MMKFIDALNKKNMFKEEPVRSGEILLVREECKSKKQHNTA